MQEREVRAVYTDTTITVYQAYSAEIAAPALRAGDVTDLAREIRSRLDDGDDEAAAALLPPERGYPCRRRSWPGWPRRPSRLLLNFLIA
jgi:hypothetical protein